MRILEGVIPVLITPLDKDQTVDESSLRNIVNQYVDKKVGGLWVLGTGAEDMCLSMSQRLKVAEVVCNAVDGRVPVILGCSFFSPAESLEFIDRTKHLEFDSYHAMPYHQKVSLDNIYMWYELLANYLQERGKTLWAYTSGNWAVRMGPEFVARLKNIPNIVGVKYSSSNMVDVQGAIDLADDEFQVITAVVKTFYACLALGVKGATSVEASVFLDQIQNVYDLYKQGSEEEARDAQRYLNSTLLNYPSPAARDNFLRVAELKYLGSRLGLCQEWVTPYYRQLTSDEKLALDVYFEKYLSSESK
ncbi:hypothetical protein BTA51_00175 [Hahella sp. CCB-MM4]|uniref:dihydrodipicolinate synthase family protein n=1 Tax=Hahella sp. (strain CCB-MM4) TaxID=1926491 RepID=UPI000B9B2BC1|nr:dihydrodipicolinate synthase family protein [Hahella sp. CCB-MM4]OZG74866.1 hypothetical protein BTA51_00175 [Hahella sp. CCB-MM4]